MWRYPWFIHWITLTVYLHFYFYLSYYRNAQVQEWKHFVFFFLSGCQIWIMVTGIPVTCLWSSRSIQVLCECLNPCTAQNTCEIYKISKHTSLLENLFSDIIQEYFPSKFRLLFHKKNYQNKTNQCRVMVQQYFIEEKAPFTWL